MNTEFQWTKVRRPCITECCKSLEYIEVMDFGTMCCVCRKKTETRFIADDEYKNKFSKLPDKGYFLGE